jgi:hypothetical protein
MNETGREVKNLEAIGVCNYGVHCVPRYCGGMVMGASDVGPCPTKCSHTYIAWVVCNHLRELQKVRGSC